MYEINYKIDNILDFTQELITTNNKDLKINLYFNKTLISESETLVSLIPNQNSKLTILNSNDVQPKDSDSLVLISGDMLTQNGELKNIHFNSNNTSNIAFSKEASILELAPLGKADFTNQNVLTNLPEQDSLDITGEIRTMDQEN